MARLITMEEINKGLTALRSDNARMEANAYAIAATRRQPLQPVSQMAGCGVIFSDGFESDLLKFNAGMKAVIQTAKREGCLLSCRQYQDRRVTGHRFLFACIITAARNHRRDPSAFGFDSPK